MKTEDIIAYKGDVELEESRWDNSYGMTVKVKLEQRPHEMNAANPFKRFTKMRRDKVGTRFKAVFVAGVDEILYDDEVMLKGWSDGTTGWKLTLWIHPNEDGLHPFMEKEKGATYALVMVELDDDNVAINQKKRERVEDGAKARKGGYRLSSYAAVLCQNPDFWTYMQDVGGVVLRTDGTNAELAADVVRNLLGIASRAELDHNDEKAVMFHEVIRKPYSEWSEGR